MRLLLAILCIAFLALPTSAEERDTLLIQQQYNLSELEVVSRRPLSQIGVMQSKIAPLVLHDNIALSLGDVLTYGSGIFVKEQGRGALSTVSFRGTAASHTRVDWNGVALNSPTLGFTDFSLIPSYFVDNAALLHGSSSISQGGGGLGGAVVLNTDLSKLPHGHLLTYTQGIGSYKTFDEYLRYTYSGEQWQSSTRLVAASSRNDFIYTNKDKWADIKDEEGNILSSYHPRERNSNGAFRDFHLLQELAYQPNPAHRIGLSLWGTSSYRQLPLLSVDYGNPALRVNENREQSLRGVLTHNYIGAQWSLEIRLGHSTSYISYDNGSRAVIDGPVSYFYQTRSLLHNTFAESKAQWFASPKLMLNGSAKIALQQARTAGKVHATGDPDLSKGLLHKRVEASLYLSAKYTPTDRLGISPALRFEVYGNRSTPLIPALFVDYLIYKPANLALVASVSRNYHEPTLNDLFYIPGGNPNLRPEKGLTYDIGLTYAIGKKDWKVSGSLNWFDSRVHDWIVWLPAGGSSAIWTPINYNNIHAYGIESALQGAYRISPKAQIDLQVNYSWTPSINQGPSIFNNDRSIGKQLVYIPRHSASLIATGTYTSWRFTYKYAYYSERFTSTSNSPSKLYTVAPYHMHDVSIEKLFSTRALDLGLKLAVKNLFNADYQTVMSYPMPGRNFELFITISPNFSPSHHK
ncbi:TonB-dependent receptor [Porphyromonas levii]|uniref:TonB-dependent receptor n=1 Tax=Porphyromonas levii TaxID=28114 RepID=UPI001BAAE0F3|nr:TonB-dependent receptor [Porphyromonas levii]MBR8802035.1 Vitamin B12 transporter BtuB [Porphyromonas levii]